MKQKKKEHPTPKRVFWRCENFYSDEKARNKAKSKLLNNPDWSKVLLDCLEKGINPEKVSKCLKNTFGPWFNPHLFKHLLYNECEELERVRGKAGPVQYMMYLDEVFTALALDSKFQAPSTLSKISPVTEAVDNIVVAMLLEDAYEYNSTHQTIHHLLFNQNDHRLHLTRGQRTRLRQRT